MEDDEKRKKIRKKLWVWEVMKQSDGRGLFEWSKEKRRTFGSNLETSLDCISDFLKGQRMPLNHGGKVFSVKAFRGWDGELATSGR